MADTTTNPPQRIEAEEFDENEEDAYTSDIPTTSSLTSSITDYEYENGRRYHSYKKGQYFLPNDEDEIERLDFCHHLFTLRIGGKLHLAPLSNNIQDVLDLGTGTGIWAIEMGDEYPTAQVLGNDLSPIQPRFIPPNVRFEVDDMEDDWTYTHQFDFIHTRYLQGSIKNWPKLVENCFRSLKPGGWIELQDYVMQIYSHDGSVKPDSALIKWPAEILKGMEKLGLEGEPGKHLETWVRDAGFTNIRHEIFPFPVGGWPKDKMLKEVGLLNLANFNEGISPFSMRVLTHALGWTKEEVDALMAQVRTELKKKSIHPIHDFHVVYAQKPLDAE
ncbi:Methyltransferase type 11 [Neofusicoccum parvum]|uniref:Methyltransferase type 11 n=1 Tax=Neofusicoccum parvum TaxID=310453 RepID=A0ACB5SQF9_9PEZI|nr:Methyltransferase type 11 [Neofusicoccum parvum]